MTLIELTVSMMIITVVGFVAMRSLSSVTSTTGRATNSVLTERDASLLLRVVSEDIRAANPLSTTYPTSSTCAAGGTYPSAYTSCVSFTVVRANLSTASCPKTVITYGLVSGVLKQDQTVYNASCVATSTTTGKVLASNLANTATSPLFTFYDRGGTQLTAADAASAYTTAATVKVTLVATQPERNAPSITVSGLVALRNTR